MSDSSFGPQAAAGTPNVALAHDVEGQRMGAPWHVYPEQAAAGLWTTPSDLARFMIDIQTALRGPQGKVLDQRTANEMITPAGVGPVAVGLFVGPRGEGWYFTHSGSNWGYRAWIMGHVRKGYGIVMMVNSDNGMALMNQVGDRVERAYDWDSLQKPSAR
jgi:CubicO group peptidase (beta-lactamase class C family)